MIGNDWPPKPSDFSDCSLQTTIRAISRDVAPDVESWMVHAKNLQLDIDRSRRLASEIVRQAEAEEKQSANLEDAETYVGFLTKEQDFNLQLGEILHLIKQASDLLTKARHMVDDGDALGALNPLDGGEFRFSNGTSAHSSLDVTSILEQVPFEKKVNLVWILENRVFDLREVIHEQLKFQWRKAACSDADGGLVKLESQKGRA